MISKFISAFALSLVSILVSALPSPSTSILISAIPSPSISMLISGQPSPSVSQFKSHIPSPLVSWLIKFLSGLPSPSVSILKKTSSNLVLLYVTLTYGFLLSHLEQLTSHLPLAFKSKLTSGTLSLLISIFSQNLGLLETQHPISKRIIMMTIMIIIIILLIFLFSCLVETFLISVNSSFFFGISIGFLVLFLLFICTISFYNINLLGIITRLYTFLK